MIATEYPATVRKVRNVPIVAGNKTVNRDGHIICDEVHCMLLKKNSYTHEGDCAVGLVDHRQGTPCLVISVGTGPFRNQNGLKNLSCLAEEFGSGKLVTRVKDELGRLGCPDLADLIVGREAAEGLESARRVVSCQEVRGMSLQLLAAISMLSNARALTILTNGNRFQVRTDYLRSPPQRRCPQPSSSRCSVF